jgi:hypothetical protein
MHLRSGHQAFIGKVVSVERRMARCGTYDCQETVVKLRVERYWEKPVSGEVVVRNLGESAYDVKSCVRRINAKGGEEWLVVAEPDLDGVLSAAELMSFNMAGGNASAARAAVEKKWGPGQAPTQ